MLTASNLSKAYAGRTLFGGLDFSITAGDRIALIGANGSGKTTLLDILAGETLPDTGTVTGQRNVTVGYLKQEPAAFAGRSLLDEVLQANTDVIAVSQPDSRRAKFPRLGNGPGQTARIDGTPRPT